MVTFESPLALRSWIANYGGGFHPDTRFIQDSSGSHIIATVDLPKDSTIVSCPFELVITRGQAQKAILETLGINEKLEVNKDWTERQWISTYLSLHSIAELKDESGNEHKHLLHLQYLQTLPDPEQLRTPLHFSHSELELFKGTNLYGATLDRQRDWRQEWSQCQQFISQENALWGELFTWEKYLTAATYLSSRAFPSTLLSPTPSLVSSSSTQPILIPGVDSLNHARGNPVSWLVTLPNDKIDTTGGFQSPSISLVIRSPAAHGQELFNNYGPKPNSELILGYGFSIAHNPDDTIVLKIGGIGGEKWEIGRNAQGVDGLWKEIISNFCSSALEAPTYEDVLDASDMLQEMAQNFIERLPKDKPLEAHGIRPDVAMMFSHYLEGQKDILEAVMEFGRSKGREAIAIARDAGIDLVLEEG